MPLKGVRIEMNNAGAIGIMTGPEVTADIQRRVDAVADAARGMDPEGEYEASVRVGRTRVRGSVITANQAAREAEAVNRVLLRALGAAQG